MPYALIFKGLQLTLQLHAEFDVYLKCMVIF